METKVVIAGQTPNKITHACLDSLAAQIQALKAENDSLRRLIVSIHRCISGAIFEIDAGQPKHARRTLMNWIFEVKAWKP